MGISIDKTIGRWVFVIAILLIANWLYVNDLALWDISVDESWSITTAVVSMRPESRLQMLSEPNNTAHVLLVGLPVNMQKDAFGLRIFSVFAGVLAIAFIIRIGNRMFGAGAGTLAAFFAAMSLTMLDVSQYGRPYIFANLFALASLSMWVERRRWWTTVFSTLVALFHVGAFPVIMLEDAITFVFAILRKPLFGRRVKLSQWIFDRIIPYTALLSILILVHFRRIAGKNISGGQRTPDLEQIVQHILSMPFAEPLTAFAETMLMFSGLLLCVLLVYWVLKRRINGFMILTVCGWVAASYGALWFMARFGDGPIKFSHLTHIIFPLALLLAAGILYLPRSIKLLIMGGYLVVAVSCIHNYKMHINHKYTDATAEIVKTHVNNPDVPIYFEHLTAIWLAEWNSSTSMAFMEWLPAEPDARGERYFYLTFRSWAPAPPEACDDTPQQVWGDYRLYRCQRVI